MLQRILCTSHKSLISLVIMALLTFVTACGGGGSGGSSPPPQKLKVSFSDGSGNAIQSPVSEADRIHIEFLDSVAALTLNLDGVNISSLAVVDNASKTAKVNIYALQGILGEKAQSGQQSTLTASVPGGRTENVSFTYEGKPDLIFTEVKEGTGRGYCSEWFDPEDEASINNCPDDQGNNERPQSIDLGDVTTDSLTIEGIVRNALLSELTGKLSIRQGKAFTLAPLSFTTQADSTPDFAFTATATNSEVTQLNLAMPGKQLSDMLALQLSDMDKNHVISQWISDALKAYLGTVSETNPLQAMKPQQGSMTCQLITNGYNVTPPDISICDLEILSVKACTQFNVSGNTCTSYSDATLDTTLVFSVLKPFSPCSGDASCKLDSGWNVQMQMAASKPLIIEMRVNAYKVDGFDAGDPETHSKLVSAKVTADMRRGDASSSGPLITLALNVGEKQINGAALLAIEVDLAADTLMSGGIVDVGSLSDLADPVGTQSVVAIQHLQGLRTSGCQAEAVGWTCASKGGDSFNFAGAVRGEINQSVNQMTRLLAYCMQPYSLNGYTIVQERCGMEDEEAMKWDFVSLTSPVKSDGIVISAVQQIVNDARYGTPSNSGFVGISGLQKTRSDGVHLNALGTHFSATPADGKVATGHLQQDGDAALAISSNWINQLLLSAYQSGAAAIEHEDKVGNLGVLGQELISQSQNMIKATDDVFVKANLGAAPYIMFADGYAELVAHNVSLSIDLSTDTSVCVQGPLGIQICFNNVASPLRNGKPYLDLVVDIKARLQPVLQGGQFVEIAKDDLMLHIISANGTKVEFGGKVYFDPSPKALQALIYPYIGQTLDQTLNELLQARTFNLDIDEPCTAGMVKDILDAFFAEERVLSFVAESAEFDAPNQQGDIAHLLAGASVVDKNSTHAGLPLLHLALNYNRDACTPVP